MTAADPSAAKMEIAVLTPSGRDLQLLADFLERHGQPCRACSSEDNLLELVAAGHGPAIVAEEALSLHGASRLEVVLDEQPSWSDLPVILLTRPGRPDPQRLRRLLRRRNVRALRRPVDTEALLGLAELAVETRRRQEEVHDLLSQQRELNHQLDARARQLAQLTVALMTAEDRERSRLAQYLHDELQQVLVGAHLHLATAAQAVEDDARLGNNLERVQQLISQAQRKSRLLSHDIFPAVLQSADLEAVLRWLSETGGERLGLEVDLEIQDELGVVEEPLIRFLYRAAQEILCNVAKHAGVTRARLEARRIGDDVQIRVSDEGEGFDANQMTETDSPGGIGLWAIRERSRTLGGDLRVDSFPGRGTRVKLTLPARTTSVEVPRLDGGPENASG